MTAVKGKNDPQELEFPRLWKYRIIMVHADSECEKRLGELLLARHIGPECLTPAGSSAGGRYRVIQLETEVKSREEMVSLGGEISAIPGVKFVL